MTRGGVRDYAAARRARYRKAGNRTFEATTPLGNSHF